MTARRPWILLVLAALVAGYALASASSAPSQSQPTRRALAQRANPPGAPGMTLGMSSVRIPPGATIPLHYHPGTQLAFVQRGTLSYTVVRGSVAIMRGAADARPRLVRRVGPGQTGTLRPGDWIAEQRSVVHRAANPGRTPVYVLVANLTPSARPDTVPVAGG